MNALAIATVVLSALALLALPRRWAPLPLLIGTCYLTLEQGIDIGSFRFTVVRLLIAVGLVRIIFRGEWVLGINRLDILMVLLCVWTLLSSVFYDDFSTALNARLGLTYNAAGIYLLVRVFCTSIDDLVALSRLIVILLIPVAAEMVLETQGVLNLFSRFGGIPEQPRIRGDEIRAFGPFAHSILAGTVGAVSLPLTIGLWKRFRKTALLGIASCVTIVITSASSGPVMTAVAGLCALATWSWRANTRAMRWMAVLAYIALDIAMEAPAYYLIGRVDITGGSTGWHRARLIEAGLQHIDEWWVAGTDYTRHWMTTGVSWSADHIDITNHYLYMGVVGGVLSLVLFVAVIAYAFAFIGARIRNDASLNGEQKFVLWTLGSTLFAHAVTCISVAYYDQSFVFMYVAIAASGSTFYMTANRVENSLKALDCEPIDSSATPIGQKAIARTAYARPS